MAVVAGIVVSFLTCHTSGTMPDVAVYNGSLMPQGEEPEVCRLPAAHCDSRTRVETSINALLSDNSDDKMPAIQPEDFA
jgi:hypothetical protein